MDLREAAKMRKRQNDHKKLKGELIDLLVRLDLFWTEFPIADFTVHGPDCFPFCLVLMFSCDLNFGSFCAFKL